LAFQGLEWLIVAAVILVLFLWGPERVPKIARALGQAKKEFEKASREGLQEPLERRVQAAAQVNPTDEKIIEAARALGISTEGKTREEIVQEIKAKVSAA